MDTLGSQVVIFQNQSNAFLGKNFQSNKFHIFFWHSPEGISKLKEQHVFCLLHSNLHRFSQYLFKAKKAAEMEEK